MTDTTIASVFGRRIWDSRGRPTVEVDVQLKGGASGRAIAPAGADLIEHIPRLQTVATTLRQVGHGGEWIEQSLHAAIHFVWAWSDGRSPREALDLVQDVVGPRAYDTLWTLHCRETQTIKKVWAAELEKGMPKDVKLYMSTVHHSDEGEDVVAGIISKALLDSGILEKSD